MGNNWVIEVVAHGGPMVGSIEPVVIKACQAPPSLPLSPASCLDM